MIDGKSGSPETFSLSPPGDVVAAVAVLATWRCSPHLLPSTLAGLPRWAQGGFLLFGPQLFYLLFPVGIWWFRGVRGVLRWPIRQKLLTEAAVSLAVLGAMAAVVGAILVVCKVLLPDVSFVPPIYRHRVSTLTTGELWAIFMFSLLVAPVCEEMFFRGFLHQTLRTCMPRSVAGALQSLVFALMHTLDPVLTPASFAVSVVLTVVYEWRRSLLPSVFLHAGLNAVSAVVVLLMTMGTPDRPTLGVAGQDHPEGCEVTEVLAGSPAATASLRPGDVIKTFDGQRVNGIAHLVELVRSCDPGDQITVQVRRAGSPLEFHVILHPIEPLWND